MSPEGGVVQGRPISYLQQQPFNQQVLYRPPRRVTQRPGDLREGVIAAYEVVKQGIEESGR